MARPKPVLDCDFLALDGGEHDRLSHLAAFQASDDPAIFQHGNGVVKGYVDVAIGVDDVLHQSLDAAIADALELWPDVGTDPVELVAGGAVCGVDIFALLGVASFFPILGDAIGDQPFNLSAWLEEILRQHRHAFLREPVADVNVQQ